VTQGRRDVEDTEDAEDAEGAGDGEDTRNDGDGEARRARWGEGGCGEAGAEGGVVCLPCRGRSTHIGYCFVDPLKAPSRGSQASGEIGSTAKRGS